MRALVTGSSGFVGLWLVRHLTEEGDDVIEVPVTLDIVDADTLNGALDGLQPDVIYHLAAQANVARSWEDPAETFAVNALGTLNLCEAARRIRPLPRVLLVSSAEVYGKVETRRMPISEAEPFDPVTPYAASKVAAEMVGQQAWTGRGLPVVRARPFNHTGPGQARGFVVPDLAEQVARAARGEIHRIATGNLEVSRDITDVRDVVRAYRLLVLHGEPGQAYNVCRGDAVAITEVLRRLMLIAGTDVPVWADPALNRPSDVPTNIGNPRRLQELSGWEARIPLDQTLADTLAAFGAPVANRGLRSRGP